MRFGRFATNGNPDLALQFNTLRSLLNLNDRG